MEKLFKVGYGQYEFYVVAATGEEAVQKIGERERIGYLPLKVMDEITEVDGYKVVLQKAEKKEEPKIEPKEEEAVEEKKETKKGTKTKVGD